MNPLRKPPALGYSEYHFVGEVYGGDVGGGAVDKAGGLLAGCREGGMLYASSFVADRPFGH
jgi:hypothetical protein